MNDSMVHFHTHSENSEDSFQPIGAMVKKAASLGHPAICVTEHGNLASVILLEKECEAAGIKAIKGVEGYWQDSFDNTKGSKRNHLTLIAKTQQGWLNMVTMCNYAVEHQYYFQPTITPDLLERYHEGIIAFSGCRAGRIPQLILQQEHEQALELVRWFKRLFGGDFYLEVQPTGGRIQQDINAALMEYGRILRVPLVMTCDAHYLNAEDMGEHRRSLLGIGRKHKEDTLADYTGKYLMTREEMETFWHEMMGTDGRAYIDETLCIAEKCDVQVCRPFVMPDLSLSPNDQDEELREKAYRGLYERLGEEGKLMDGELPEIYVKRIENELHVFAVRGFSSYILMCGAIMHYARTRGIFGGLRGSGGGSLALYALGCSNFDPIEFNASFERFFSLVKTSPPDVDFDFADDRRDEIYTFLEQSYPQRTMMVGTTIRLDTKSLVKDLGEMYQMHTVDQERMDYAIRGLGKDATAEDIYGAPTLVNLEHAYPGLLHTFLYNWQTVRHHGEHAAAMHITTEPINTVIPMARRVDAKKRVRIMTAWEMKMLEICGIGVKVDILAVAELRQIVECLAILGLSNFDMRWVYDERVYEALRTGKVHCFQFTRKQARDMLREARVTCFEDVASVIGINRPGSLKTGAWPVFLGKEAPNPYLAGVTGYTRGAMVYQEQWRDYFLSIGLDGRTCDRIEKYAKKPRKDDEELHTAVVQGAMDHGVPEEAAHTLWARVREYLFNRAHAVSYAIWACVGTYLSVVHPQAWNYATLLTKASDDVERPRLESETVWAGMPILPAHVNGDVTYTQVYDTDGQWVAARRGLAQIEGIGPGVAEYIVRERQMNGPYTSVEDIEERFKTRRMVLNRTRLEVLRSASALEFDQDILLSQYIAEQKRLLEEHRW